MKGTCFRAEGDTGMKMTPEVCTSIVPIRGAVTRHKTKIVRQSIRGYPQLSAVIRTKIKEDSAPNSRRCLAALASDGRHSLAALGTNGHSLAAFGRTFPQKNFSQLPPP